MPHSIVASEGAWTFPRYIPYQLRTAPGIVDTLANLSCGVFRLSFLPYCIPRFTRKTVIHASIRSDQLLRPAPRDLAGNGVLTNRCRRYIRLTRAAWIRGDASTQNAGPVSVCKGRCCKTRENARVRYLCCQPSIWYAFCALWPNRIHLPRRPRMWSFSERLSKELRTIKNGCL